MKKTMPLNKEIPSLARWNLVEPHQSVRNAAKSVVGICSEIFLAVCMPQAHILSGLHKNHDKVHEYRSCTKEIKIR